MFRRLLRMQHRPHMDLKINGSNGFVRTSIASNSSLGTATISSEPVSVNTISAIQSHFWTRSSTKKDASSKMRRHICGSRLKRSIIVSVSLIVFVCLLALRVHHSLLVDTTDKAQGDRAPQQILQPLSGLNKDIVAGPKKWLRTHWNVDDDSGKGGLFSSRPRAAIISLVRNEELEGILQSMRELESHWNHKYQYPWIFFNEKPFSDKFKVDHPN